MEAVAAAAVPAEAEAAQELQVQAAQPRQGEPRRDRREQAQPVPRQAREQLGAAGGALGQELVEVPPRSLPNWQ